MTVVADASPLIFLGKLGQLDLISTLFAGEILVPNRVRDEVLRPPIAPDEHYVLTNFLGNCTLVRVVKLHAFAAAMSVSDSAVLTLAVRKRARLLLADDRLLRRMARIEEVRPLGTLGILLTAMKQELLTPTAARRSVQTLVRVHDFRIGVAVFEAMLSEIAKYEDRH